MNKQCVGYSLVLAAYATDALSAASEDTTVATASVDGTVIVVTGVSAGDTEIVVQAGSEEFHVPVQVGG